MLLQVCIKRARSSRASIDLVDQHAFTGVAVALRQAQTEEFKAYQVQTLANADTMAKEMMAKGYHVVSGGTDNHLILVNLKNSKDIDGARVENVCDKVQITLNKNSVPGDKSALNPGGMRLGAHALTSRGFKEAEFKRVVELVDKAVEIAKEAKAKTKTIKEFNAFIADDAEINAKCDALRSEVNGFALKYPMPGFDGH